MAAKIGVPVASMGETVLVRAVSESARPLVLVVEDEPEIAALLDLESNAHSENESVHLGEFRNCCINEAMLLGHLASWA
jgi:hypothetical protein